MGIHQGKPAFACAGNDPPRWLVKAKKANKIQVIDDKSILLGNTVVHCGEVVRRDYLKAKAHAA
jgi:hypothetical protein